MSVNVNPIMAAIVEAADTLNTAPDDYINPDDGLIYCGRCHTPKEAYFPEQYRKNGLDKHPIACKCAAEERARREAEQQELEREKRLQHAMLDIKKKFGKNAILKGMNLCEGATAKERNDQIGGHKA